MRFFSLTGTRDMSPYGRECVNTFLRYISGQKNAFAVVSGLAVGTDTCLHQGALEMGINTVAVLPTGLDAVYPSANKALAERIASTPGCALLSCFPTQTLPEPTNMIRRNHVIAGMALETYVTETKHAGGAAITARLARQYDRKVYAFPGRIDDERSRGCNELIREKTARLFLG
jgi:DNA processing protein